MHFYFTLSGILREKQLHSQRSWHMIIQNPTVGGFTYIFHFHPWGNDPIWLYTSFQMGWNHWNHHHHPIPSDQAMPRNPPDCLTSASGCSVWTPSSAKPPMIPAPWAEHTQLLWHLAIWKSDFQFWIPRLDTSISFLLKTKLSPFKIGHGMYLFKILSQFLGPMLVCLALGPKMADMALWDWTKSTLESLLPSVAHWLQLHAWQWTVIYKSQRWAQHPWWIDLTWRPFRIRWLEL